MSKSVEERLAALENAFAEIKKLKGIPGSRGPAGDIGAAVNQATKAATASVVDAEGRLKKAIGDTEGRLQKIVGTVHGDVKALRAYLDERIAAAVDNAVVKILQDYHLINENCEPTYWKK